MDNFNQMLLSRAYRRAGIAVHWTDIFGSIDSLTLRNRFPTVAVTFKNCHALRLISSVPHAYSKTLGTFARDVKIRERDRVQAGLRSGYQEYIRKIT